MLEKFVIVEGPNGSGKTTLINNLKNNGFLTLSSPNGTELSRFLRSACRGTEPWEDIDAKVQFLLFSAARLDEYIRCVKDKSEVVIADRWWTSTYVYQCVLQSMDLGLMEKTVHPEERVGLVIILDADDEILLNRVFKERAKNPAHGTCSWTKDIETQKKVANIYRNDLPEYLKRKNIKTVSINTNEKTSDDVYLEVLSLIRGL